MNLLVNGECPAGLIWEMFAPFFKFSALFFPSQPLKESVKPLLEQGRCWQECWVLLGRQLPSLRMENLHGVSFPVSRRGP